MGTTTRTTDASGWRPGDDLADLPKACGCDRQVGERQIDDHDWECTGCGLVSA